MLTPDAYDTSCDLAGAALLRRVPGAASILQVTEGNAWSGFSAAVYIAADHTNAIRYVGSTIRTGSVGDRIQEHVLAGRADPWTRLMVVPLRPDTDEILVRKIEGRVGAVLRPLDTMRLPTLGRRHVRARIR
ncbi:hypothetical protein AB0F52_08870 [Amycolatopsis sp. NPDC024027]|uniref:hypothetical protein n=1 Tax=Amycolatopsis sp. NPDC024027 TaxID=3154327 RepID=UPI0033EB1DCB